MSHNFQDPKKTTMVVNGVTLDIEDGVRTWLLPERGKFYVSHAGQVGDFVKTGKKLYRIGKNRELVRVDKRRKK